MAAKVIDKISHMASRNHSTEKNSVIDEIDRNILCALRDNGRISFRDL